MQQKDFRAAVYLVDLVFSAHLLHFRKQVEGLSVTLLLDIATQCQKLFHGLDSGQEISLKMYGLRSGCTRLLYERIIAPSLCWEKGRCGGRVERAEVGTARDKHRTTGKAHHRGMAEPPIGLVGEA